MRGERYEKFVIDIVAKLRAEIRSIECIISFHFVTRHDGPFSFKEERRMITRNIRECRQKRAALAALKKQTIQPVTYLIVDGNKEAGCPTCDEYLGKEWHYKYCPYCGQRLDWGDGRMKKFKNKLVGFVGKEPIIGTFEQADPYDAYTLTLSCMEKQITCYIPGFTPIPMAKGMLKSYAQDLALSCLNLDESVIEEGDNK